MRYRKIWESSATWVLVFSYICFILLAQTTSLRNSNKQHSSASKISSDSFRSLDWQTKQGREASQPIIALLNPIDTVFHYIIIDASLSVSRNRSRLDSPALQLYFWPLPADACRALCGLRQNEWGKEVPFQPVPKLSEAPLTDMRCFSRSKKPMSRKQNQTTYDLCWVLLHIVDLQWVHWYQYEYRMPLALCIEVSKSVKLTDYHVCQPRAKTTCCMPTSKLSEAGSSRIVRSC
jgi:hypothetical protein